MVSKTRQPGVVGKEEASTIRRRQLDPSTPATEEQAGIAPTIATAPPLARAAERADGERQMKIALDVIDTLVIIANLKTGTCDFANKRWLEHTGQVTEGTALTPFGWADALHADDRDHIVLFARTAIEAGVEAREECRLFRRRDRNHAWFELHVVPMCQRTGSGVLSFTDIDEARRMKHELQELDAKMRRGEKMQTLGQLAGGVAHDFNNLLTIIVSCTDEALEQATDRPALRESLHEIRISVKRAASLTRDLLGYTRQEEQDRQLMSLDDVVGETERMLARIVGEDIELRVDRGGRDVGLVKIDPAQWTSVMMNLAVNARHAMPRGGMLSFHTTARVVTEDDVNGRTDSKLPPHIPAGRYAVLEVRDTGVGFGADVAKKIFEPFFTTKSAGKGTGLGLAVVKKIVDESEGFIGVMSEVGRGTTFRIYLPSILPTPDRSPLSSTLPKTNDARDTAAGRETILLVEDDPAVRRAAIRSLEARGFTLLVANDAEEALTILEAQQGAIDLIITDVVLPKMNGKRLVDEVSARYPKIRALFTSGYANDDVLRYGLKTSAEGVSFLAKPYTPRRLVQRMREVLDDPRKGRS